MGKLHLKFIFVNVVPIDKIIHQLMNMSLHPMILMLFVVLIHQQNVTKPTELIEKSDSRPKRSDTIDICITRYTDDSDCIKSIL
jgi:hypothetical protein